MNEIFCTDCTTTKNVYSIITNTTVEPLCSECILQREATILAKESGRTELEGGRFNNNFPYLTVKQLKEKLEGVPDGTPVLYQRIEDIYFETHGWTTHEMEFEYPDNMSEYIVAFSAYWHPKKNAFVVEAHY